MRGLLAAAGTGLLASAGLGVLAGTASAAGMPGEPGPIGSCAEGAADLPPDAIGHASEVAEANLEQTFPDRDVNGAYVTGATRSDAGQLGQQLVAECGPQVQSKSVIVNFLFPAMLPDADRAYGAAVVSDVGGEYTVWRTA